MFKLFIFVLHRIHIYLNIIYIYIYIYIYPQKLHFPNVCLSNKGLTSHFSCLSFLPMQSRTTKLSLLQIRALLFNYSVNNGINSSAVCTSSHDRNRNMLDYISLGQTGMYI